MLPNQPQLQISLGIGECKCTNFSFTEFAKSNTTPISKEGYEFNYGINIIPNESEETISITIQSFLTTLEAPKQKIAEVDSHNIFIIKEFKNIIFKIGDNPAGIMPGLIAHLLGLSISALRGMYSAKLEGTIYNNAILPIVDLGKIMENAKQLPIPDKG